MARQLSKMQLRRTREGRWIYPPLDAEIKSVGLEEVETYILCRQITIAEYIATQTILDLCLVAERRPRAGVLVRWWEQAGLDLVQVYKGTYVDTEEEGGG